jgi:hypothetical protein
MILFDEQSHTYTVSGEVKRSVTGVLRDAGICDYRGVDDYYRDRGTLVHEYCELLAQGWLDLDDYIREDCLPYVKTFKALISQLGLSYVSSEGIGMYSLYECTECDELAWGNELTDSGDCPKCWGEVELICSVCGKYDLIMMWEGKRTLVEIKTGTAPMWLGLQLASYERMVDVDDVLGISLKDGGRIFGKAEDYHLNHEVLKQIHTGEFSLADWKKDRNRRRMKLIRG